MTLFKYVLCYFKQQQQQNFNFDYIVYCSDDD
jgi:hypothetical protein